METKICTICNEEKFLDNFHNNKNGILGKSSTCKICTSNRNKIYRSQNLEKYLERTKINNKKYRMSHKKELGLARKKFRENNYDKIKIIRDNYKLKRNDKQRFKRQTDPAYRLKCNIRSLIRKNFTSVKKSKKAEEILGCTFEEFKQHLESQFESWMTWDNYGLYNGQFKYGWDIDHIIPSSSVLTENEIIQLNHYTNLQPLCSHTNRDIKKARY